LSISILQVRSHVNARAVVGFAGKYDEGDLLYIQIFLGHFIYRFIQCNVVGPLLVSDCGSSLVNDNYLRCFYCLLI